MKPLPSAPPTLEDSDIWLSIVVGYGLDWATAGVIFRDADRRDAELMLAIEYVRRTVASPRPADYPGWPMVMTLMLAHEGTDEWLPPPGATLDITDCA